MNFPGFDGDSPKLWQKRSEDYFAMYSVDPTMWIKVSTMYFTGAAARWLQSVEVQLAHISWLDFCHLVRDRFGKDEHVVLVRQLFHIRQTSSVADYVERFSQLIDQLRAYCPNSDPLYHIMRFVDGLREDIRSVVMVQRPRDLDTAFVLAQLQEEAAGQRKDSRRYEASFPSKTLSKNPLPLLLPPHSASSPRQNEQLSGQVTKGVYAEDKVASLFAYRKAKGLCYKCGMQYSKGHRCAETIQLHVVEELCQFLQVPEQEDDCRSEVSGELHVMSLSQAAVEKAHNPKTMQFLGSIQGVDLLVLLDSGSSHSFVSSQVADQLQGLTLLPQVLSVQVANGSRLQCTHEMVQTTWSLGGCEFQTTLRVLPLQTYDLIVGMDWLEQYNPMWVHWADKSLIISYKGSARQLFGLQSSREQYSVIEMCHITELQEKDQTIISTLPADLQSLLSQYQSVFAVPKGLPPPRECDHHIHLLPGVQSFHMRPYRYAPALKTEVEKQVAEMLAAGIIQPSQSEFSSSVILVKKKDDTYRFCVELWITDI